MIARAQVTTFMDALALPGSVPKCHEQIEAMNERILALEPELSEERRRVAQLTPDAERYQEIVQKNRASTRRPRSQ